MSNESEDIKTAASNLVDAMSALLRAVDAVPDGDSVVEEIPEDLTEQLQRLATRLDAVRGFTN